MTAKYLQIAREIKKRIISQQYPASAPLPDQFALAAEFSTSRMTIQQAMRQLIVEGLIYTRKGQGTFVRKNFLQLSQWELPGSDYFGATKTWEHLGEVQSEVVRFAVRFPSDKEQSSLLIDADAPVYDFVRLRLVHRAAGSPGRGRTFTGAGIAGSDGHAGGAGAGVNQKPSGRFRVSLCAGDAGAEADGILPRGAGDEARGTG